VRREGREREASSCKTNEGPVQKFRINRHEMKDSIQETADRNGLFVVRGQIVGLTPEIRFTHFGE
jgi:hypothetical protein